MNAEKLKSLLPIITAFANGQPIQFRPSSPQALTASEWLDINPNTTEFRISEDMSPAEWRVKP